MHGNDVTLGSFLRARRSALNPRELGLVDNGKRRSVPGLRREELAELAHVSVDYIVRIEQGRSRGVSSEILTALAEALRLSPDQRTYLFAIARSGLPLPTDSASRSIVPFHIHELLRGMHEPALVLNHRWEVLSWNPLAARLLADFDAIPVGNRNLVRMAFLDPAYRQLFGDHWESTGREGAAVLRLEAAQHPDDWALANLIKELRGRNESFHAWWDEQTVSTPKLWRKTYHHPEFGRFAMDMQPFAIKDCPNVSLVTYTPPADRRSQEVMRSLTRQASSRVDG